MRDVKPDSSRAVFCLAAVALAAAFGLVFAAVSTYDFVQHLDRQVHALHCSFIPGLGKGTAETGCHVAMMSPYSSVFRAHVWGGIPISLPAMSVFAFLVLFAIDLFLTNRKHDARATGFFALATALPAAMSLVMLIVSLTKLGTTCKLCVGIYLASGVGLAAALVLWRDAVRWRAQGGGAVVAKPKPKPRPRGDEDPAFTGASAPAAESARLVVEVDAPAADNRFLGAAFGLGVAFVAVPVLLYLALAPDHGKFVGTCESLPKPADTYGVMVRVDAPNHGAPTIELLDPLCPACRAFEQRLAASGRAGDLDRKAILFPLDNTCNWMVTETTHPGACTISEAVLCAGDRAPEVIAWAFDEQDRIREETKADPSAAARIVKQRFPDLASCVGSAEAKSKVNKSLRWAVANNIRVLTPQLFVDNVKLCDEDVDLGLEYSLRVMLERHAAGTLASTPVEAPPDPATTAKPTDSPSNPSDKPADKAADKPADKAVDKPADQPSDKATDKPGDNPTDKPVDKPAGDKPAADKPAADKPADKPAADKPAADKPAGDKPAGDKPAGDKPVGDKPAVDKPAGDKPSDKPITKPSDTEGGGTP